MAEDINKNNACGLSYDRAVFCPELFYALPCVFHDGLRLRALERGAGIEHGGALVRGEKRLCARNDVCGKRRRFRHNVALGLSLFGLSLIAGKFSFSYLSDRLSTSRANTLVYLCVFIGLVMSLFVHKNLALLYVSMLLFGFGSCMGNVGLPVWASDFSRAAFYPETYNLIQKSFMIGNLVFNPLVGPAADLLGTYRPVYLAFAVLSLVSYVLIQSVYKTIRKK